MIVLLLSISLASTSIAAPLSPRQLVLPGAGGTNYWWPSATTSTSTYAPSIASSVLPSSTVTSTSISSSISSISPSLSPLSAAVTPAKPFNFLYLIPLFAVVGLLILGGVIWLIHGCCTRKPKYRPPPPPPVLPPPQNISFKAFRYEDIPPVDSQLQYTRDEDYSHQCQHVQEYGFQCDCRHQTYSHDHNWPSDTIDRRDENHVDEEEKEDEERDAGDGPLDIRLKDDAKKDSRGFRMVDEALITSSSPLSQLSTRITTPSNGSWMEKVVNALGSRFSSGSGKDEDRYTAIPVPSSSGSSQRRMNKLKKGGRKRKSKKATARLSSNLQQSLSDRTSITVVPPTTIVSTAAAAADTEEEEEGGRVVLLSQERRLQNHRDSIASLPAGMVFSPPSVGFPVFGEEDGFITTAVRDKSMPRVLPR